VESDFFWLCVVVQLLASLRFVVRVRQLDRPQVTAKVVKLAAGQRQDSWLASALIWAVILCKGSPYGEALFAAGSVALIWLIFRACQRVDLVLRGRCE
jgi:hypothetical protein